MIYTGCELCVHAFQQNSALEIKPLASNMRFLLRSTIATVLITIITSSSARAFGFPYLLQIIPRNRSFLWNKWSKWVVASSQRLLKSPVHGGKWGKGLLDYRIKHRKRYLKLTQKPVHTTRCVQGTNFQHFPCDAVARVHVGGSVNWYPWMPFVPCHSDMPLYAYRTFDITTSYTLHTPHYSYTHSNNFPMLSTLNAIIFQSCNRRFLSAYFEKDCLRGAGKQITISYV